MIRDGAFTAMAQRRDSELEVATACADGRVLFWDKDYTDPVMVRARARTRARGAARASNRFSSAA